MRAVEVHVASIAQIFNSLDPSPFHDRDLDHEAARFIRESAEDLPAGEPCELVLHLRAEEPDHADVLANAIHAYFGRELQTARRELRELLRFGRFALVVGLLVVLLILAAARVVGALVMPGSLASGVAETLTIVAWVVLWRPVEILLFDWWPVRRRVSLFARLAEIPVRCVLAR